jgi:GT2 family glycosyltransferase
MTRNVCAIVVTFNRKDLLAECLTALSSQTCAVAHVFVIDNASTDGTPRMIEERFSSATSGITYVRLPENVGGAGGFRAGLAKAHENGHEWLWLMDDDTIPTATALQELLSAYERFPTGEKPRLLASKVEWTDGTLHPMNFPTIKRASAEPERAVIAATCGTLSTRWSSFVSLLIHRSVVDEYGLPFADYFIWNDDTEFTARVLRRDFGVLVPTSVVVHKTARKHSPIHAAPERSYYQVRNVLWMILRSPAWRPDEKLKIGVIHLQWIAQYLSASGFRFDALRAVARGLRDGFLRRASQ